MITSALRGGRDPAKELLIGRVVAGMETTELADIGEEFAEQHLRRRLRPQMSQRIDWHRAHGHEVVIVSASPSVYVEPAGRRLGADAVIATVLEVDAEGRYTGRFRGRNCRGTEKAARLATWLGGARPRLWAYGNSGGDDELLAMADVAVRVGRFFNPDLESKPEMSARPATE